MFTPHSRARRSRRALALVVAGALAVGLLDAMALAPLPAEAVPCWDGPDEFDCPEITGTGPIIVLPAGPLDQRVTKLHRTYDGGYIGPDATGIQLKTPDVPLSPTVDCGMSTYESGNPWWRWQVTAEEWAAGVFLPFGDARPSGGRYELRCSSTVAPPGTGYDSPVGSTWTLFWSLYPTTDPTGAVYVALTHGVWDDWWYVDTSGLAIDDLQVAPGDRIQIVGPPATFRRAQWGGGGDLRAGADYENPVDTNVMEQTVGVDDGSMIYAEFQDAVHYSPPFFSEPVWIDLSTENTSWRGKATMLSGDHPTAVKVAVSSSTATSKSTVKATVRVTVPYIPNPEGRVDVLVDGKRMATTVLGEASRGRATITLPKIWRGTHKVTAVFRGSENLAPSTSAGAYLRILF